MVVLLTEQRYLHKCKLTRSCIWFTTEVGVSQSRPKAGFGMVQVCVNSTQSTMTQQPKQSLSLTSHSRVRLFRESMLIVGFAM